MSDASATTPSDQSSSPAPDKAAEPEVVEPEVQPTLADVSFRPGRPEDVEQGVPTLLREAVGAYNWVWGTEDPDEIERMIHRLFLHPNNRFSYKHSVVAEAKGKVCGIMIAYTYEDLSKLFWPTSWMLFKILGPWRFFKAVVLNVDKLTGREADVGEYHAFICGVNKPFRRLGLATMFVFEAERIAREIGSPKVSCTAEPGHKALKAGLALGYEIVETVEIRGGDDYCRIVKTLDGGS